MLATLFPLACPGCGCPADPICDACSSALAPAPIVAPPDGVDAWGAPFAYEGAARELIARVKYRGAHAATAWLARAMAPLLGPPLPELVTWAPTTAARRHERGFDHAELLARAVATLVRRPVRRALVRQPGRPQTGLAAAERRLGPGFEAKGRVARSIVVVDDVATTGATAAAAAGALRGHGAERVFVLTAARTPSRGVGPAR